MRLAVSLTRRQLLAFAVVCACTLGLYHFHRTRRLTKGPSWEWLQSWERDLPQHSLALPLPEGSGGRYVRFLVQSQCIGLNNYLSELLMNAHLAHESGRGFVFPDYVWADQHYPFGRTRAQQWPPRTPLNALISGPTAGGQWEAGDDTPRSISSQWFDTVCPPSERLYVNSSDMKSGLSWSQGEDMLNGYVHFLRGKSDRCIDIMSNPEDNFPQLFDVWLWGDPRVLSLWKSFSASPVSRLLGASHIVKAVVDRNVYSFIPRGPRPFLHAGSSPFDRVLALHLRRGDFESACRHYGTFSSRFNGWNQLENLPDRLSVPEDESERLELYRRRCSPTVKEIAQRVREVEQQHDSVTIDTLYLLTNEKGGWLDELTTELRVDGKKTVITSQDIRLENVEEQEVAMVVDMEIARLAEIFIGNGWSSFSSNIVHRRLVYGKEPLSIHFY